MLKAHKQPTRLRLRKNARSLIKVYLIFLLLLSFFASVWISGKTPTKNSVKILSILMSLLGSSIFYVRKLYKCEIREEFIEPDSGSPFGQGEIGGILYYVLRPIIASVFGFLFFVACFAQLVFASAKEIADLANFSSFIILSSFIIGYSIGDLVDQFESLSRRRIGNFAVKLSPKSDIGGGKNES